jgi:hypothetical protein
MLNVAILIIVYYNFPIEHLLLFGVSMITTTPTPLQLDH